MSRSAAENAGRVLPRLASEFLRAGNQVAHGQAGPEDLHAFRLKAKRFRYTLELFRPCYATGLEPRLAALRLVQEHLGQISDCITALGVLEEAGVPRTGRGAMLYRFLDERMATKAAQFRQYWRETFGKPGAEQWLTEYLRRFARERKPHNPV